MCRRMSFQINLGEWNSVFAVPASLVDSHMRLAGAVQLKVLLWCLRHAGQEISAEMMADAIGASPADIRDAMQYWVQTGLLRESEGLLSPPSMEEKNSPSQALSVPPEAAPEASEKESPGKLVSALPQPAASTATEEPAPAQEPAPEKPAARRRIPKPDGVFVSKRILESSEIRLLMNEAEAILGRPVSPGLSSSLLLIHDDYGLPADVIVMLLQYAKKKGRDNTHYIEAVARGWASDGVFTLEAAEQKLRQLDESTQAWRRVETALGIPQRSPSSREEQFARRWVLEWKFSDDMLREAYNRCVDSTGRMNLSYINRILERWHKAGIMTPQQAAAEQTAKSAARGQEQATSFDLDEYERTSGWGYFRKE